MPLSGMMVSDAPQPFWEFPRTSSGEAAAIEGEKFAQLLQLIFLPQGAADFARGSTAAPISMAEKDLSAAPADVPLRIDPALRDREGGLEPGPFALGDTPTRSMFEDAPRPPAIGAIPAIPSGEAPGNAVAWNEEKSKSAGRAEAGPEVVGESRPWAWASSGQGGGSRAAQPAGVDPFAASRPSAPEAAAVIAAPPEVGTEFGDMETPQVFTSRAARSAAMVGPRSAEAITTMKPPTDREGDGDPVATAPAAPVQGDQGAAARENQAIGVTRRPNFAIHADVAQPRPEKSANGETLIETLAEGQTAAMAPGSRRTTLGDRTPGSIDGEVSTHEAPVRRDDAAPSAAPARADGQGGKLPRAWAAATVSGGGTPVIVAVEGNPEQRGAMAPLVPGADDGGDRPAQQQAIESGRTIETPDLGGLSLARSAQWQSAETELTNRYPLIDHLASEIVRHLHIGRREAVLRLDPPELGHLKIELRLEDGKLHARLVAERAESRELIENHLPELRHALLAQRIDLTELRFAAAEWKSAGDSAQGFHQSPPGQQETGGKFESSAEPRRGAAESVAPRSAKYDGRVSLWA